MAKKIIIGIVLIVLVALIYWFISIPQIPSENKVKNNAVEFVPTNPKSSLIVGYSCNSITEKISINGNNIQAGGTNCMYKEIGKDPNVDYALNTDSGSTELNISSRIAMEKSCYDNIMKAVSSYGQSFGIENEGIFIDDKKNFHYCIGFAGT